MNKILRYSLVSLLTLFFGTAMAQTTFNFNEDYQSLFPTLPGVSSSDSNDGDFNEATTCTLNGISITVSAKEPDNNNANRIWSGTPRLRMYSGTLTVTAPEGKNLSSIEIDNGKWNNGNTVDNGTLDGANWTGTANSVVFDIAGNTQINSITVYIEGETPEPAEMLTYKKATTVEHGKKYLWVVENDGVLLIAKPVESNYGYLYTEEAKANEAGDIELTTDKEYAFTLTSEKANSNENQYFITQPDGRYLYQTGTFDSFNASATPDGGELWNVEANSDGTFKITNVDKNKYVQYDPEYNSFGCYGNERGIMPCLYVLDEVGTGIEESMTVPAATDENAPVYNLAGQRVSKDTKGILIQNGKKFINK